MKCTRLVYGLGPIVILISIAGVTLCQEVAPESNVLEANRAEFFAKFAVTDYDSPLPEDADELEQRRLKNQRYDKLNWVVKNPPLDTDYARRSLKLPPPPVFPIEESDLIITGLTTTASAYLSNDKTGVYTEYTVRVEQVLKAPSSTNISPGSLITIDRAGGTIRYPDGHKVAYFLAEKGLPAAGNFYALFLRDDRRSKNFEVVTLYELKPNGAVPLDQGNSFYELKGMTKRDFLKTVQDKVLKRSDN